MKEGRGEIHWIRAWISVLALLEIAFENSLKHRIGDEPATKAIQEGGVARNRGGEEYSTRPKDPAGLCERTHSLLAFRQMVQRPEEEDRVRACAGPGQF